MKKFEVVNPAGTESTYQRFGFSQGVKVNGMLICSGQVGSNPDGSVPENIADEYHNAWQAVGRVLEAAGCDYSDIVDMLTLHKELAENLETYLEVKSHYIKEPYPAWTAWDLQQFPGPGQRIEIKVTAVLPAGG